jgi:formamidopyrimidine-DNA glycosylase
MPELPEVEIAARNLRRWLAGERIFAARFPPTRVLRGGGARLVPLVRGRTVEEVTRRGKWIRIGLSGGVALFSHLGMTGKWVRRAPDEEVRFERARLDTRAASVRYLDPRMFGRIVGAPDGAAIPEWEALGPDPLVDGVDARTLAARLAGRRRSIKEVLLDQNVLAGVGNIQATEALWRARIPPTRAAASLSPVEVRRLAAGIRRSIADTLAREEGPEITYVEEPGADNPFRVYGRAGEPCPRCGARLARIEQGGRGTVFCRRCQKK